MMMTTEMADDALMMTMRMVAMMIMVIARQAPYEVSSQSV